MLSKAIDIVYCMLMKKSSIIVVMIGKGSAQYAFCSMRDMISYLLMKMRQKKLGRIFEDYGTP